MPRKTSPSPYEPPKKRGSGGRTIQGELKQGEIIVDNAGKKWKLGKAIGIGGFGEIYDISEYTATKELGPESRYVAKFEKHTNGPLFVEINCYLRLGKFEMIKEWKRDKRLNSLGLPHFVASGSHTSKDNKYRFLILPKYDKDLEAILQTKKIFNLKTVLVIASRIIDTLEYIHGHGYVHSDIKAPNIMLGGLQRNSNVRKSLRTKTPIERFTVVIPKRHRLAARTGPRNLRTVIKANYVDDIPYLEDVLDEYEKRQNDKETGNEPNESEDTTFKEDEVYLIDYGLASKFLLSSGDHREFGADQRRAHAGTILFCSRDAHKGIASRRSDLESLAYNMVYWLTGTLPWIDDVQDFELVEKKKNRGFTDVKTFLQICFEDNCPNFLVEMFTYLSKLQFMDIPKYNFFRELFKKAIKTYGYQDDSKLDFDHLEGSGKKQKKVKSVKTKKKENENIWKRPSLLLHSPLKPLSSNIIFKRPKLRKKDKTIKNSMMNWSKILMDPETIVKQAAHRRNLEDDRTFNILEIDLESLNPTPAMRDVFNRASERKERSPYGDELSSVDPLDGYTCEMMRVHNRMTEQRKLEFELSVRKKVVRKTRGRKGVIRTECPSKNVRNEVSVSHHTIRKVKSIPLKRTYSLRG